MTHTVIRAMRCLFVPGWAGGKLCAGASQGEASVTKIWPQKTLVKEQRKYAQSRHSQSVPVSPEKVVTVSDHTAYRHTNFGYWRREAINVTPRGNMVGCAPVLRPSCAAAQHRDQESGTLGRHQAQYEQLTEFASNTHQCLPLSRMYVLWYPGSSSSNRNIM